MVYKFVWPSGWTAGNSMTVEQYEAACKVAQRFELTSPVTVHPTFGNDGSIMIQVPNMWLGIEKDGYTHS
jgi:hypothetical protein